MSSPPPVATTFLPELHDGRDNWSVAVKLINQLRRRIVGGTAGLGLAYFSTAIGRGDILSTTTSGAEVVGLAFQLPSVYPTFTVNFAGEAEDSALAGVMRIRMGGTYGNADGTVVASFNVTTNAFKYYTAAPSLVTANGATLVQMTLQSTAGNTAKFREGFLIMN